jgi:hypothetical protein
MLASTAQEHPVQEKLVYSGTVTYLIVKSVTEIYITVIILTLLAMYIK